MIVRQAVSADHPVWAAMLAKLHSDEDAGTFERELAAWTGLPEPYVGFLAFTDAGAPVGMINARVRNYAEGAPNLRAAYLEDLWVEPDHRRRGVATALLSAVEDWARGQELDWIGSDAEIGNTASRGWHRAVGLAEVEQLVVFGKPLA